MLVSLEPPNQPAIIALIADLDAYQLTLYPAESVYALDMDALAQPNVLFAVARNDAGDAIGCAAVVITPEFGELKRMYVRPEARGLGVARKMLDLLEGAAAGRGCAQLTLETGPYQHEALKLYASYGYQRCGPYGDYPDDPFSIFMRKQLAPQAEFTGQPGPVRGEPVARQIVSGDTVSGPAS